MFIEKITICNLFAYYGKVEVEFGRKIEGKNLYCIYGNNGYGKTSFIRCAKLLFLGVTSDIEIPKPIKRFAPKDLSPKYFIKGAKDWLGILNRDATKEMQKDFFVSFEGILDGQKFTLMRSFVNAYEEIDEKLVFRLDKETFEDSEAQDRINTILPPNLTEFFFFDGEELEELSKNLHTELRGKIEEILQIKPLDILIKQIDNCKNELCANEDKNKEQRFILTQTRTNKELKESELEHKKQKFGTLEKVIEEKISIIANINKKIERLSADSSRERAELIAEKNELDRDLSSSKNRLRESIKSVTFLSNGTLLKGLREEIQILESNKSQNDIEVLKKLLPELKELVSKEIQANEILKEAEIKKIENILDKLPNKLESRAFAHSFIAKNMLNGLRESLARLDNIHLDQDIREIKEIKNKLQQNANFLNELNSDDTTREKQAMLQIELEKQNQEKKIKENEKQECKDEIRDLEKEIESIARDIDTLEQNINTERIGNKLKILESLQKSVQHYREKLIDKLKNELHSLILENYQKLSPNGNIKEVEIDEDFKIQLKDENNEFVIVGSQSKGQQQILAIAIFWALSKLSQSSLPLIIDTPLSRIDSDNRARVIQNYYFSDNQVIILPHDGEMTAKEYEYAKPRLAELYKIDNQSNGRHATIRVADFKDIL